MCAKVIAETLMQFGSGTGLYPVATMTKIPLPWADAKAGSWDMQVVNATADGTVSVYKGNDASATALQQQVPALASEPQHARIARLAPGQDLYATSSAACVVLFRLLAKEGGCGK